MRTGIALVVTLSGCGQSPSGKTVEAYIGHLHAGRYDRAYGMLSAEAKKTYGLEAWKTSMHTDMLADAQDVSISGIRTFDPGGTCVYGQIDFVSHPDQGPHGYYIFYLSEEAGQMRIFDVMTYDRIEGDGLVKTGHFDDSREPWPCSSKRP